MARIQTATIASGAATSDKVSFQRSQNDYEVGSIILDGTYTNTSFDIQTEIEGTWYDIYDVYGTKVSIAVADGKHSLQSDSFKDVDNIRIKGSGNEGADRTIQVLFIDFI